MEQKHKTRIRFYGLPSIFPDGYIERIELNGKRPVKIGVYSEKYVTDKKFKTLFDDRFDNRRIQSVVYDKYRIEIIRTESQTFELLDHAENATVTQTEQGILHYARVLNVNIEDIPASTFQKVTIEYYDFNFENYFYQEPISNFLKSGSVRDIYGTDINRLVFTPGLINIAPYSVYTILNGEQLTPDATFEGDEIDGARVDTRTVLRSAFQAVYFVGSGSLATIKRYLQLSNGTSLTCEMINEGLTYTAIERPEFTIEAVQGANDLYKLTVTLVYDVDNIYIFENATAGGGGGEPLPS